MWPFLAWIFLENQKKKLFVKKKNHQSLVFVILFNFKHSFRTTSRFFFPPSFPVLMIDL